MEKLTPFNSKQIQNQDKGNCTGHRLSLIDFIDVVYSALVEFVFVILLNGQMKRNKLKQGLY